MRNLETRVKSKHPVKFLVFATFSSRIWNFKFREPTSFPQVSERKVLVLVFVLRFVWFAQVYVSANSRGQFWFVCVNVYHFTKSDVACLNKILYTPFWFTGPSYSKQITRTHRIVVWPFLFYFSPMEVNAQQLYISPRTFERLPFYKFILEKLGYRIYV